MALNDVEWWLALNKLELLPKYSLKLLKHFQTPKNIFSATLQQLQEVRDITPAVINKILNAQPINVNQEMELLKKLNVKIITIYDNNYPANLKQIFDPPPLLFIRGELKAQDKYSISIVGTRSATPYGKIVAQKLAASLAQRGLTIISGLARGIDGAAHQGALEVGGRTIGVLGCGIDVVYPRENQKLIEEIANKSAIISEFPFSSLPLRWHFPARNRVISGLSLGTILVEAPEHSGALITAEFALEQGREVFAVPGNINMKQNRGTHKLIKEGAKLVEDVNDVLEELGIPLEPTPAVEKEEPLPALSIHEQKILDILSLQPQHVDRLAYETQLATPQVLTYLLTLELKGLIRRVPGNQFIRVK